jgi:hypothetical protein
MVKTLTREEAEEQGYAAVTREYGLPSEQWMLEAVLKDMRHADVVLVPPENKGKKRANSVEVWRKRAKC